MIKELDLISSDGIKLYEYECENPKAVVCTIHGIGEHFGRYERVAGFLNKENIAMIGIDLKGHGKSSGKRGHCAPRKDVLKDVDNMLLYAKGKYSNIPIILYGHSMGGNIGLDYRYEGKFNDLPDGYIISAPWVKLVKPFPKAVVAAVGILSKLKPDFTIGSSIDESTLGNPEIVKGYKSDPLVHSKISMLTAIEGFTIGEDIFEGNLQKNGKVSSKPLLLMHGTKDKICSIEGAKKVKEIEKETCEYISWPGLYHEIHNGGDESTGQEVISYMISWIKKFTKEEA